MAIIESESTLSAADTYCEPVSVDGEFNFSVTGTWVGSVTVQRSFDGGLNWGDVEAFNDNVERRGSEIEDNVQYRAGFKVGEYTSGSAIVRLSR